VKDKPNRESTSSGEQRGKHPITPPPEPHLLDAATIAEAAKWLVEFLSMAAITGVVGNAAYDYLKSIKRRHGSRKIRNLEARTLQLIEEEAAEGGMDVETMKGKISKLFEDFR
jgi:hypothetical protein